MPPRKTGRDLYGGAARPCSTPSLRVSEAARSTRSLIPVRSLEHVVARGRWEPAASVRAAERFVPTPALRGGDPDGDRQQDHRGSLKVASMGREPHMRTYQKHIARSMMSSLPRLSLPFPCQARSREKTLPATLWRFAAKPLILLSVAPELGKFSRYFPAGRENSRGPNPPRLPFLRTLPELAPHTLCP